MSNGRMRQVSGKMEDDGKKTNDTRFMSGNYLPTTVYSHVLFHSIIFAFLLPRKDGLQWSVMSKTKIQVSGKTQKQTSKIPQQFVYLNPSRQTVPQLLFCSSLS